MPKKSSQKVENEPKMSKIPKFLNHVFKTSKKTLSNSRTYCKIYKIENIGKIGQSRVVMLAKRVIYYGSTWSTLSTPSREKWTPHFSRWFSKSGKKWNFHFWGFLSQNVKNVKFGVPSTILRVILSYFEFQGTPKSSKTAIFNNSMKFPYKIPCKKSASGDKISPFSPPKLKIPSKVWFSPLFDNFGADFIALSENTQN